ncbi:unnamed protein product [Microthlaspi erraticum]|uniref:Uncharacterized protein n=1 Tax=Microthlaspi erraticum TaxID=1685480 RepID=A0A6D2IET9_9BRAS|nr:unnamed protein product [Microthlaspi erraticum]
MVLRLRGLGIFVEVERGFSAPPSDVALWSLLWRDVAEVSLRSERRGGLEALRTGFRRRFVQGGGFSAALISSGQRRRGLRSHGDDCGFSAQFWPSVAPFNFCRFLLLLGFVDWLKAQLGDDSVKA